MNVIAVPEQKDVADALIDITGVVTGVTDIVIGVLVSDEGIAQTTLLINSHVTTSLFNKVDEVKLGLLEPTLNPLTFH